MTKEELREIEEVADVSRAVQSGDAKRLIARIRELEAALKPFAEWCAHLGGSSGDDAFSRAADALSPAAKE